MNVLGRISWSIVVPIQQHDLNVGSESLILVDDSVVVLSGLPRPTGRMQFTQAAHRYCGMRMSRIQNHLMSLFKRYVASDFSRWCFPGRASRSNEAQFGFAICGHAVSEKVFFTHLNLFVPAVDQAGHQTMFPDGLSGRLLARID
ncbi:hypothetical protein EHF33_20120 (plasmid) [Deinococcus psychrotolerans]|uniref:Uncharacterized protein n=1 Tax=Deinococcus psychrotolerans TaxID=2489213 RepID=A0A3G8YIW5_9DEIO|nr:hypothetical protein [Deinococcus psychrotolerans]AZI45218.1 hypothetical protein EHF33_20120 [Deinococcus psychrotolerans]